MKIPVLIAALLALVSFFVLTEAYVGAAEVQTNETATSSAVQTASPSLHESAPRLKAEDYPYSGSKTIRPRVAVWLAAQMHLWFAAFILAVPIFVVIIEAVGACTKDKRYDRMAHEFMRVSMSAYTLTLVTGILLAASLFLFYPGLMRYLSSIFKPTFYVYGALILVENAILYVYYYGWGRMGEGGLKLLHLFAGFLLAAAGTAIMLVANAWVTFMMTPAGVDASGALTGGLWQAVNNHLFSPMNLHRFIANISFGGSIVGAYAAYRFLGASTQKERAHYDWMGYTANLIAIGALLPLPFAGYWLTAEVYAFSQQMGITLMGGVFAWLFIIQAVIICALFLAANYYLWCGMGRTPGGARYTKYIKYIAFMLTASFLVWFTPHTLILKPHEAQALGGQYHPYLGPLGLMPAKNIAVNVMLLFTFLSFILYRRAGRDPAVKWVKAGSAVEAAVFGAGFLNIVYLGVYYGYFTNTVYKVASSVPQIATTLFVIIFCLVLELVMFRKKSSDLQWGNMPGRSQYALFLITVSFTWLMGLMGYIRSAIRQHWHVYSVVRDASPDAFTPTIGYAANVVSTGTIIFMGLVVFIFWLSGRGAKGAADE